MNLPANIQPPVGTCGRWPRERSRHGMASRDAGIRTVAGLAAIRMAAIRIAAIHIAAIRIAAICIAATPIAAIYLAVSYIAAICMAV